MKEMLPDGRAGLPVEMDLAAARSVLPGIWPEKRLEMPEWLEKRLDYFK